MMIVWVGIAAAGLLSVVVWSRYRTRKDPDLGVVSHQWLAEHRLGRSDSGSQR